LKNALSFNFDPHDYNADPVEQTYRNALGDGLERVLGNGVSNLSELAAGLNSISVTSPLGQSWTEELLESELRRLAW
jgi:hypothetical protein